MGHIVLYCQPGARLTRISGEHDGLPRLQIQAPPVDGAANEAIIAFLARHLRVPRSRIRIRQGQTHRIKRIEVDGLDDAALSGALRPGL